MRAERRRGQADQDNPAVYQPPVVRRREMLPKSLPAWKQPVAGFQPVRSQPSRESLARRFGDLERNWPAGLALADGRLKTHGVARWMALTRRPTRSHPCSLLSTARLNRARSRVRFASCRRVRRAQMCFGFSGGSAPMIRPRFQGTRGPVGTETISGMTGSGVEEPAMRNAMLPLSPMSNDGSLRHEPVLAPTGLGCCSRPVADLRLSRLRCSFKFSRCPGSRPG
jgi:hypothetical protein